MKRSPDVSRSQSNIHHTITSNGPVRTQTSVGKLPFRIRNMRTSSSSGKGRTRIKLPLRSGQQTYNARSRTRIYTTSNSSNQNRENWRTTHAICVDDRVAIKSDLRGPAMHITTERCTANQLQKQKPRTHNKLDRRYRRK
jgi:hypothetical protein